jgi:DNA polymerase-1
MVKRGLIFDLEADGLLEEATRIWVVSTFDLETKEKRTFEPGDYRWIPLFQKTDALIGHNIIGYDLEVIRKVTGEDFHSKVLLDTLLLSQLLDFRRFGADGHSMGIWGTYLGFQKIEHEDWSQYSPEMRRRCEGDVELNLLIWNKLKEEWMCLREGNLAIDTYIEAEHYASRWNAIAHREGWKIDVDKGLRLESELEGVVDKAVKSLQIGMGTITEPVDKLKGVVDVKEPVWTKDGRYDAHTARWFDIDPWSGYEGEERLVEGPYCRVRSRPLQLTSVSDVKTFLFRNGWVPTTWNFKTDQETGKKVRSSPKITEDSLEFMKESGKLYSDFAVANSRLNILKTWLRSLDKDHRLHGNAILIGTPSLRARHQIIVNIPSVDAAYGKEFRDLFTVPQGWVLIGADSKGNQARGLAYYLNNAEFENVILNKDIHEYNADKLTKALFSMKINHKVPRSAAKRVLYAFLFGASGGKLWSYIFEVVDEELGSELKKRFLKAVPGFEELLNKLKSIYSRTKAEGEGWIPNIVGMRLYVDSYHKLLVYLLQGLEKVTCSTALMLCWKNLQKEGITFVPMIYYHDEFQFLVREKDEKRAKEIAAQSFKEGPKMYGINIMGGDSKSGKSWLETH